MKTGEIKQTKTIKKTKYSHKKLNKKVTNQVENIFVIHHLNLRGTIGKIEEVFNYIEDHNPDMLLISESKLDESVTDTLCEPPGYRIIRKDRSENFKKKV